MKVQNSSNKFFIPQLTLETGEILKEVEIAYSTYGELSKDGKNGVLIFHALTGSQLLSGNFSSEDFPKIPWNEELETGWWDEFVGPNKIIDTNKYFVVCANYLGGCYGSTGPNSKNSTTGDIYGYDFPHISFKDIEESQKLLLDDIGVTHLEAVIGPSIGGLMALEFCTLYPDFVNKLISISSGYKLSTLQLLHNLEQGYILDLSRDSRNRQDEYLSLARMIAHKTYISLELLSTRAKNKSLYSEDTVEGFLATSQESYMMHQGEKFIERFTAESYNSIIKGWQNFNLETESIYNLRDIKTLVISVDSDVCFYPEEQKEFVEILNAFGTNQYFMMLMQSAGKDVKTKAEASMYFQEQLATWADFNVSLSLDASDEEEDGWNDLQLGISCRCVFRRAAFLIHLIR